MSVGACILGCSGPALSREERAFFKDVRPWGFILFARNVETPDQVAGLTEQLRETVDRPDAPILVDQEGGRVQRLRPPNWKPYPPAAAYGRIAEPAVGREASRLAGRLIAHDLAAIGISVDCAPVLDVPAADAHVVVGDRAFGDTPQIVASLGRAFAEGLIAGRVLPVVKHSPGHGRARTDSHAELPVVEADGAALAADLAPFRALSDMPMAMTAHVVLTAFDAKRPATLSRRVIRKVIREQIGFEGLLMSDDLSMRALSGDYRERAAAAAKAGCDMVLHGGGDLAEMKSVVAGAGPLKGKARRRADAALARRPQAAEPLDAVEGRARLEALFEGVWAP